MTPSRIASRCTTARRRAADHTTARRSGVLVVTCLALASAVSCKRSEPEQAEATGANGKAPSAPTATPPEPAPKPWFEGRWRAQLDLTAAAPTSGAGLPREWKQEPKEVLGPAHLEVHFGSDEQATGTLHLGSDPDAPRPEAPLTLFGALEGDTLRATLEPAADGTSPVPEGRTLRGTLVAAPPEGSPCGPGSEPSVLEGTLRLSSGDGLLVRRATVSLERAEPTASDPAPR